MTVLLGDCVEDFIAYSDLDVPRCDGHLAPVDIRAEKMHLYRNTVHCVTCFKDCAQYV